MEFSPPPWRWDERTLSADAFLTLKRIFSRCERNGNGCLIWGGCVDKKTGYGRIGYGGHQRTQLCHRLAFMMAVRMLERGEHVDHRCHNADSTCTGGPACVHRRCVEPSHLEAVTQAENNRRAREHADSTPGSRFTGEMRGTCKKGLHPWVPKNIIATGKQELCRACNSDRQHAYDLKRRGDGVLSQRPTNPVWAALGLAGCRECGSNQNAHRKGGLCHTCYNRHRTGERKRERQRWLA